MYNKQIQISEVNADFITLFSHLLLMYMYTYMYMSAIVTVYNPPPPRDDPMYWIIGVVLGGLVFIGLLIWCILFIYFRCTRQQPARSPRGSMASKSPRAPRKHEPGDDVKRVAENGKQHPGDVRQRCLARRCQLYSAIIGCVVCHWDVSMV